jgi:hypothetical protein
MLETETHVSVAKNTGNAMYIYVPSGIVIDSAFPLEFKSQKVMIKIKGNLLVIEAKKE